MAENIKINMEFNEASPSVSSFDRFRRVFFTRKLVLFGVIVILLTVFSAFFAPVLTPYDPYEVNLKEKFINPGLKHPLGTDYLGRDVLTRLLYGSRTSMIVGVVTVALSALIGMSMGLISAYFGGKVYAVIMRFIDTLMTLPLIMLALAIASMLGGGLRNVVIALAIAMIPPYARMMCGQALSVKENDYVTASRVIGSGNLRIMLLHIAPNCFPPLIVMMTMQLGNAILAEAGLSFLGVGVTPPGAAWGAMVNDGYKYLYTEPLLSFVPGIAIMLVVFAFNMVGDGLRDALDPRLRGAI
jgi:ABC-type dipeptide/oligopeptide/nickel transport system permease subunit